MGKRKNLVKIAIYLIIIGGVMSIIGFVSGGFKSVLMGKNGFKIYDSEDVITVNEDLEKFNSLYLDIKLGDVKIIKSDKYAIELVYNDKIEDLTYKVENEKLTVKSNGRNSSVNFGFNFGDKNDTSVTIYVPTDSNLDTLDIENKSGSIVIDNIDINTSNINCDFGSIDINGINGQKVNINAKAGEVNIKNMKLEELDLFVDFGDVEAENIITTNFIGRLKSGELDINSLTATNAKIDSDFGDINASDLYTNGILVNAKSGAVELSGELKGENTIQCDFGDIDIRTDVAKNQYSYTLDMDFGSSKIDGNKSDGNVEVKNDSAPNKFNINCGSGDVTLDFTK